MVELARRRWWTEPAWKLSSATSESSMASSRRYGAPLAMMDCEDALSFARGYAAEASKFSEETKIIEKKKKKKKFQSRVEGKRLVDNYK